MIFLPFTILNKRLEHSADRMLFIILAFSYIICWTFYIVIGHGRYGQTIGKRLMGIKLLDIQEQNVIGYKRSFYREAIWLFAGTFGLIYFVAAAYNNITPGENLATPILMDIYV